MFPWLKGEKQDLLFFMTARYHLAVVSYDGSSGDLVTRAYGDMKVGTCFGEREREREGRRKGEERVREDGWREKERERGGRKREAKCERGESVGEGGLVGGRGGGVERAEKRECRRGWVGGGRGRKRER